jgi:hypothetical protein
MLELFAPPSDSIFRRGQSALAPLTLWPEQYRLLLSAFDFDAVGFDGRIILKGLMNDTAIKSAERLQLDDVAPAANFFGSLFGLLDQRVASLGAIAADIHHYFGRGRILLEEQPIRNVLKVGQRLTLPANQASGIVGLYIQ